MSEIQHESKLKFLDAAMQVIRTKGYEATSVEDVCLAAGLTKGSFFHHFKSKEELAIATAEHFAQMAEELFAQAPFRELADPLDRVMGYVEFRRAILRGSLPQFTCVLGTMVQETYETHPAIRQACERLITGHAAELSKDIAQAKQRYAPRGNWTPQSLGLFTQAVIQGAFILAKARHGKEIADDCLSHLHRYLELLFKHPTGKE